MCCSRRTALLALFVTSTLLTGCSISYSTGKSSDSISASLDSISSGSGGATVAALEAGAYVEDVAAATALYASGRNNSEYFLRSIGHIARSHGIVDWEHADLTYGAMGRGLRRAGIAEEQIGALPYFQTLAGRACFTLLLKGYHQS